MNLPTGFIITEDELSAATIQILAAKNQNAFQKARPAQSDTDTHDRELAKVIAWSVTNDEISCNQIMQVFGIGWKKASAYSEELCDLGIVEVLLRQKTAKGT